jgi:hypothetical protein
MMERIGRIVNHHGHVTPCPIPTDEQGGTGIHPKTPTFLIVLVVVLAVIAAVEAVLLLQRRGDLQGVG